MGNNIANEILKDLEKENNKDFYNTESLEALRDADEITSQEAGFMMGYNSAAEEEE